MKRCFKIRHTTINTNYEAKMKKKVKKPESKFIVHHYLFSLCYCYSYSVFLMRFIAFFPSIYSDKPVNMLPRTFTYGCICHSKQRNQNNCTCPIKAYSLSLSRTVKTAIQRSDAHRFCVHSVG